MTKHTYRYWLGKWKKAQNDRIKIVSSLSKKTPYGKKVNGKAMKNKSQFLKELRKYDDKVAYYRLKTISTYKKQTGKDW